MPKFKQPTVTNLVMDALKAADDFMNHAMLCAATGGSMNQVSAATHHLRKRNAIDVVVNPDGTAWWYATPETDNRLYVIREKAPEDKPRKRRRTKPKIVAQ